MTNGPMVGPMSALAVAARRTLARVVVATARRTAAIAVTAAVTVAAGAALAGSPAMAADSPFGGRAAPLDDGALDRVRGGFADANLSVSFGLVRTVSLNGVPVATTVLNWTSGGAPGGVPGGLASLQVGGGNVLGATVSGSLGTVVQNARDGQTIRSVTVIDATANSLDLMRRQSLQSSLRGAVIDSLRR